MFIVKLSIVLEIHSKSCINYYLLLLFLETLTKDEKRKREYNEKDKNHCKRIKQRYEEIKEKSPDQ